MKKSKVISMVILSAVLVNCFNLTACSNKNNKNEQTYSEIDSVKEEEEEKTYLNIDSLKEEINEGKINAITKDFQYDDRPYNIMKSGCTFDNEFFYYFSKPNIKINLTDGKVFYFCDLPGCAHTQNSPGCRTYYRFGSALATTEGFYYVPSTVMDGSINKVMLFADGKDTEILTNKYYTDYEEEFYPDNKNIISTLCIHGRELYVIAPSYYFVYNMDTKEIGEMKKLPSSGSCMSFAVSDNYVYYSNADLELYVQDKRSGENKKIADKVGQVCCASGKMYYIQWKNEGPFLYSADENGDNPVKIVQDCYVNYYVADNCIYYQNFVNSTKNVYKCDLNGENTEKIVLKIRLKIITYL